MVQSMIVFLQQYLTPEFVVFIISMLPIAELRGGLIAASIYDIPWIKAAAIAILGNILPVPFIILFIKTVFSWLKKTRIFSKIADKYETKALKGASDMLEKYPTRLQWALYIFVAIPLPMTGAWTGSLIAAFLGIPLKRSLPSIIGGVCTAAVIMLILAYLAPALLGIKS